MEQLHIVLLICFTDLKMYLILKIYILLLIGLMQIILWMKECHLEQIIMTYHLMDK